MTKQLICLRSDTQNLTTTTFLWYQKETLSLCLDCYLSFLRATRKNFSREGSYFRIGKMGRSSTLLQEGDFNYPVNTPNVEYEKNGNELIKYKKLLRHNEKHPYVSECIDNGYIWGEDTVRGGEPL